MHTLPKGEVSGPSSEVMISSWRCLPARSFPPVLSLSFALSLMQALSASYFIYLLFSSFPLRLPFPFHPSFPSPASPSMSTSRFPHFQCHPFFLPPPFPSQIRSFHSPSSLLRSPLSLLLSTPPLSISHSTACLPNT